MSTQERFVVKYQMYVACLDSNFTFFYLYLLVLNLCFLVNMVNEPLYKST